MAKCNLFFFINTLKSQEVLDSPFDLEAENPFSLLHPQAIKLSPQEQQEEEHPARMPRTRLLSNYLSLRLLEFHNCSKLKAR
jgi:hypothetical protein